MTNEIAHRPVRVGVFDSVGSADRAVHGLLQAGFKQEQISVVCSDKAKEAFFAEYEHERPAGTDTPHTAAAGGILGAMAGGLVTVAGLVATGGLGLLVMGPLFVGTSAAVGTFVGAMMSRGWEPEIANYYDQALRSGRILVAAEIDDVPGDEPMLARAERALHDAGAEPIPLPAG